MDTSRFFTILIRPNHQEPGMFRDPLARGAYTLYQTLLAG